MQRADVVTAQVRRQQFEGPVTEPPRCLDESEPRDLVTATVIVQSAVTLKRLDGRERGSVERPGLGSDRAESGTREATL